MKYNIDEFVQLLSNDTNISTYDLLNMPIYEIQFIARKVYNKSITFTLTDNVVK